MSTLLNLCQSNRSVLIDLGKTQKSFRNSRRIVLGVTGSIAAFRAAELCSILTKEGAEVDVILTPSAQRFVGPMTFEALSRRTVTTDDHEPMIEGQPAHIFLADHANLVLIAPATANIIAKVAHGIADNVLTSMLLATLAPIVIAPAMNGKMWEHPATRDNVEVLKKRGVEFIGPAKGLLACGYEGVGRLWPVADIAQASLERVEVRMSSETFQDRSNHQTFVESLPIKKG